jgi:7-cyano-7-deazaguanine reductase
VTTDVSLERWPNPTPDREYLVRIEAPEFTCLCPRSGYPDFAVFRVAYVPAAWIVELRSLKLYIGSYRDVAISHEAVTNRVLTDLAALLEPNWLHVQADFNRRGNVHTVIDAWHRADGWSPSPDLGAQLK